MNEVLKATLMRIFEELPEGAKMPTIAQLKEQAVEASGKEIKEVWKEFKAGLEPASNSDDKVPKVGDSDKDVAVREVQVRTKKGTERRCRSGHCFGSEPKTIEVTAKELDAIKADDLLIIE